MDGGDEQLGKWDGDEIYPSLPSSPMQFSQTGQPGQVVMQEGPSSSSKHRSAPGDVIEAGISPSALVPTPPVVTSATDQQSGPGTQEIQAVQGLGSSESGVNGQTDCLPLGTACAAAVSSGGAAADAAAEEGGSIQQSEGSMGEGLERVDRQLGDGLEAVQDPGVGSDGEEKQQVQAHAEQGGDLDGAQPRLAAGEAAAAALGNVLEGLGGSVPVDSSGRSQNAEGAADGTAAGEHDGAARRGAEADITHSGHLSLAAATGAEVNAGGEVAVPAPGQSSSGRLHEQEAVAAAAAAVLGAEEAVGAAAFVTVHEPLRGGGGEQGLGHKAETSQRAIEPSSGAPAPPEAAGSAAHSLPEGQEASAQEQVQAGGTELPAAPAAESGARPQGGVATAPEASVGQPRPGQQQMGGEGAGERPESAAAQGAGTAQAAGSEGPSQVTGPSSTLSMEGPSNTAGLDVTLGSEGPSGSTVGSAGPTGAAGSAGPTGAAGSAGPTGTAGPAGPSSAAGPSSSQDPSSAGGKPKTTSFSTQADTSSACPAPKPFIPRAKSAVGSKAKPQGLKDKVTRPVSAFPSKPNLEAELGPRLSVDRKSGSEDEEHMNEETKRMVPLHLIDNSTSQHRPSSGSRRFDALNYSKKDSSRGDRPGSPEHTARSGSQPSSRVKGPLRPESESDLLPFKQLKPPRPSPRPPSNKPGPFGIKAFNQQQARLSSAESVGYYSRGSEGMGSSSNPGGSLDVHGQGSRAETPADHMRGHARGDMSRGASKKSRDDGAESRRWSRWGHESAKSRMEDESTVAGLDAKSAQADKPAKVFRTAKLGGHTAGIGGHAAKLLELGLQQQTEANQDQFFHGPELGGLVTVKTVNHGDRAVKVDQLKRRKPGHLFTTNTRGRLPGAALNRDREGQARRVLALAHTMYGPQPMKRKYIPRPPTPEGVILDGFMLLEAGNDDLPEGVYVARLPSRNIHGVEVADMAYFTALKVLDLADNRLPDMTLLAPLVGIRALSLAMNRLGPVPMGSMLGDPGADAFQLLATLDLSYNCLDAQATMGPSSPLCRLPALRELNLSGNKWLSLPHLLGPFKSLELLKLAENGLMSSSLIPLAALPALKLLGLAHNQIEGLMGVDGSEESVEEALSIADLDARTSFTSLHTLDLTNNRVRSEQALKPLQLLPSLKSILLAGTPLAAKQTQAARRAGERRAQAKARADKGDPPGPELLELQPPPSSLLVFEPMGQLGPRPSVGRVLAGGGGHFVAVQEPLGRQEAAKAATLAAVTAAVPEEAVTEVFNRADAAIEVWQLNTVPEEEEEEEEDSDQEPDGTFLTGVGITEKTPKQAQEEAPPSLPDQEPSGASSHSLWEEVSDPTERLALALGLDPTHLAIHTGIPTTDATGAVNALRYALAHPLVELGEGLGPGPKHLELTAAARAKQRPRLQPLGQASGATFVTAFGRTQAARPKRARTEPAEHPQVGPESSEHTSEGGHSAFPVDARTIRVQHVEGMLTGMRSRLDMLESTLAQQLTKLPPEVTARAQRSFSRMVSRAASRSTSRPSSPPPASQSQQAARPPSPSRQRPLSPFTADLSVDEDDDEADAEERLLEPDSPSSPSSKWPQQSGKFGQSIDPAASDVSSLPDDVVDAIENSDPSASSGDESDKEQACSRRSTNNNGEATPHTQPPPLLSPWKAHEGHSQAGNQRYSPGSAKKDRGRGQGNLPGSLARRGASASSSPESRTRRVGSSQRGARG